MKRRTAIAGLGAAALLATGGYALRLNAARRYGLAAAQLRRPMDLAAQGPARMAELVRMASLAPNSHNSQAWRFTTIADGVKLEVDRTRITPVVDPDEHHLFVSLGAAAETFLIAASAFGLQADPNIAPDGTITFGFAEGATASDLASAIPRRQSHRGLYDETPLSETDFAALMTADPALLVIEDPATKIRLIELSTRAYGAQLQNAAYRAELQHWLRFSAVEATERADGLFSGCSGSPALPEALGQLLFPLLVTADAQMQALGAQMASAPALALLVTPEDSTEGRIETGRRLQRLSLTATLAGLSLALINPALETAKGRRDVAALCKLTAGRPSILLRLGRTKQPMPFSQRRPAQAILLS